MNGNELPKEVVEWMEKVDRRLERMGEIQSILMQNQRTLWGILQKPGGEGVRQGFATMAALA